MFAEAQQTAAVNPALKVLTPQQNATVIAIAEQIIPETDTPGAKSVGVDRFIDVMLADWMDDESRANFLKGLADLDARSQASSGKVFAEAAGPQQVELLKELDDELAAWRAQRPIVVKAEEERALKSETFFALMKHLTLLGYFTSQAGAQQALHYQIIPESPDMCAPLAQKESE
jgi:gluconate 2-dehydrogenase gamma chain